MRAFLPLALAALLLAAAGARAAGPAAEEECLAEGGSLAYANDAADFPYTVDYTVSATTPEAGAKVTTFVFKVCSTSCAAGAPFCQRLAAMQLRLADAVLAAGDAATVPASSAVTACLPRGPGALFEGAALGELSRDDPATAEDSCTSFYVTVPFTGTVEAAVDLPELCEQDVVVKDVASGAVVFDQAKEAGDSCVVVLQLADGTSGLTYVKAAAGRPARAPPAPGGEPTPYPYGPGRRLQAAARAFPPLERLF